MKERKVSVRPPVLKVILPVLFLCLAIVLFWAKFTHSHVFALPDKMISQNAVELCSPYANLCFTRPSNWTRSTILHVAGTAENTVEINPPTGTILEFAKLSSDTNITCDTAAYKDCVIKVTKATPLENDLSVVTGMLIDSPDANCSDNCATPKYMPFVTLVSQSDFNKYKLGNGTSTFTTFNPTVHVKSGQSVYLQVTPGKDFSVDVANQWQNSSEAKAAQNILGSARLYKR